MPRNHKKYISTIVDVCFDNARGIIDRSRGMMRLCLMYAYTVLEVWLDRARGMFRPLEVYFGVQEKGFDHARGLLRPYSRYVLTLLEVFFYRS